ncbi:HPr family phosphocarrier protein [Desulfoplanes formicivorans]|uniref:Phosphocarrier protein HPr n=1 Tax=Desulfoplanes formicivorans TaxID=1592317 RepID=A0A194ALK4_9BACT|nr:HPr family phosphocarrier protein [Desulfoplanes formicivorans]GAU09906.1 phosphocarrier protein HPr [Desulfoplanes formicivorans]
MHEVSNHTVVERSLRVKNKLGLHARPAAIIARTAQRFKAQIWIIDRNKKADAKSILDILCLAIPHKAAITIKVCGQDAVEAMDTLDALFERYCEDIASQE